MLGSERLHRDTHTHKRSADQKTCDPRIGTQNSAHYDGSQPATCFSDAQPIADFRDKWRADCKGDERQGCYKPDKSV